MTPEIGRRQFIKLGVCGLAFAGLGGAGWEMNEREELSLERISIPIPGLKEPLGKLKIVQMSDMHLHPYTRRGLIARAVALTNRLNPDLVLLTGDLITDGRGDALEEVCAILGKLAPRLGAFAVLGNHDYNRGVKLVQKNLEKENIKLLRNSAFTIEVEGAPLCIAGLDDAKHGQPNLNKALEKQSAGVPTILMAHEPDIVDHTAHMERVSLQLSGHSHGGQVRIPGLGALYLPRMGRKYDCGLYRVGSTWLYTNRGLGVVDFPLRINCPPEVTLLTLRAA